MTRKRPGSIEDYQRKERERQAREAAASTSAEPDFTRGQQADRDNHIKRGQEAWKRHKNDATWLDWLAIGQALSIGRQDAMAAASTNRPSGSAYNAAFGAWLERHGFHEIDKGDRSRLFDVMDNLPAIEQWRGTLASTLRLRLNHPNSVLRKWKAETVVKPPKEPKPTLRDSVANLSEENAVKDQRIAELEAHVQEAEAAREMPAPEALPATLLDAIEHTLRLADQAKSWPAISERQQKQFIKLYRQACSALSGLRDLVQPKPEKPRKPRAGKSAQTKAQADHDRRADAREQGRGLLPAASRPQDRVLTGNVTLGRVLQPLPDATA
jgi:hypothetical protein